MRITTLTAAQVRVTAEQLDIHTFNGRTIELWRDTQTAQADVTMRYHYIIIDGAWHGTYAGQKRGHSNFQNIVDYWYEEAAHEAAVQAPVATMRKQITYDRKSKDYRMEIRDGDAGPWQLVGYAKTHQVAETALDQYIYELLTHTAVESADQAADVAELETLTCDDCGATALDTNDGHTIIVATDDEGSCADAWLCPVCWQRMIDLGEAEADRERSQDVNATDWPAAYAESSASFAAATERAEASGRAFQAAVQALQVPVTERVIGLKAGVAHELDDGDVKDAYVQALRHPEMQTPRWQNALNRAMDHLVEDRFVVAVNNHGAYCWRADDEKGGDYAVAPGSCQCPAFHKDQPCKHRAAGIILSLLPVAEEMSVGSEVDWLFEDVMRDVERVAA